jgi:hypothetical protein
VSASPATPIRTWRAAARPGGDQLAGRHGRQVQGEAAAVGAGQEQQVVREPAQPLGLLDRRRRRRLELGAARPVARHELELRPEHRERAAQLVARVGDEGALPAAHHLDGPQRGARQREARQRGQHQRDRPAEQEHVRQARDRLVALLERLPHHGDQALILRADRDGEEADRLVADDLRAPDADTALARPRERSGIHERLPGDAGRRVDHPPAHVDELGELGAPAEHAGVLRLGQSAVRLLRERGDVRAAGAQRCVEGAVEMGPELLADEQAGRRQDDRHDAREGQREPPADGQVGHRPPSSRRR